MDLRMSSICEYLKGSHEGARCAVADRLVRTIADADMRICMSRHHEVCSYYILSLRRIVASGDAASETSR